MPAEKLILAEALVLSLSASGEKFAQVRLFSPERGLLRVLKRNRTKANGFSIDLFDQGEAHLDYRPGESANAGFLTDFVVSKKRLGLGKSYPALKAASWLSGLITANPLHEDELSEETYRLTQRALDALSSGAPPFAVTLKTLYLFARDEGYPVLEDWARNLKPSQSEKVAKILNTPLNEITIGEQDQEAAFASLAHYVEHNTHIHLQKK